MKMPELKIPKVKIPGLDLSGSDMEKYLSGVQFPAAKDDLISSARKNDAPEAVLDTMETMPDRAYSSIEDVMKAMGGS